MAKVLTMLLVIVGHSAYYNINTRYGGIAFRGYEMVEHSYLHNIVNLLCGFIYQFHMPFFMALSGMTYAISYDSTAKFSTLIHKKSLRLLLPMIFVTIFLSVPAKYFCGYWSNSNNILKDIIFGQVFFLGNSHLWFVASLFIITVVFTYILKSYSTCGKSTIFWIILVLLSYSVEFNYINFQCSAISESIRYFLFFSLGFFLYDECSNFKLSPIKVFVCWIIFFVLYLIKANLCGKFIVLIRLLYLPLAIFGCVNMIATSKLLVQSQRIVRMPIYKSFRKYSYELYLYSDPFNYILIPLLILVFGNAIIAENIGSLSSFIIRIVFSIIGSYLVIFILETFAKFFRKQKTDSRNSSEL